MNLLVTMFLREECYMLPDYEIKRAGKVGQKIDVVILFVWMLLVIQTILFVFIHNDEQTEAMRFRLVANSNTAYDQQVKMKVQEKIAPILVNYEKDPDAAIKELENTVVSLSSSLQENMTITKGQTIFPPKEWESGIAAQTQVEAIVVSIGSGRGDNWWCGLFPKACYKEEVKEEKPKFFVWEWLKKKFST